MPAWSTTVLVSYTPASGKSTKVIPAPDGLLPRTTDATGQPAQPASADDEGELDEEAIPALLAEDDAPEVDEAPGTPEEEGSPLDDPVEDDPS